ncbi:uncharacterized protein YndB with AHSA1/START domain [Saccharopolyspora erythraea NRRL 2338]|uniref:Cyclase/dehydrase n=2 Tax=Saccharopolyspora erythraea TaxID=1836 RepID=A4FE05_SACEN|nr:SRPBCC family protein [Saccharopolyspora erythraea]EQD81804.1 cyclase [Saccharopolyspora erythraea D]PFG96010.1 uncharacterized protein YndB with AHSA1/START domain [Saccharopolyspora erythraea NRRL 2338]QRK92566.1 SRPBCC family protein [Saccharopolyspora erythraea]CAM02280.1 cyclase/dehydrase [Saccharopolyspora erythraea NRRL 2338]
MEWTGARYADGPVVRVQTWVAAPPSRVWEFVSDVERMPDLSDELQSVRWVAPSTCPALGARFVGSSRHESLGEWSTSSRVVEFDPPRVFAWEVEGPDADPSATWRFTVEPDGGGTSLRQEVRMGPGRSGLSLAIERMPEKEQKIVFVRMREFEANMTRTLAAVKELAEGSDA